jgi:hypothetical protein
MKTTLVIIGLAMALSFTGNAANIATAKVNRTESMTVTKANNSATMKSGKTKHAHAKAHHEMSKKTK